MRNRAADVIIAFRYSWTGAEHGDYLRSSAEARETYAAAKREAARLWGNDRPVYTEAKPTRSSAFSARRRPAWALRPAT